MTPLTLIGLCLSGALFTEAWALDRAVIDIERNWWLVFTGHFAHAGVSHLLANLVGIIIAALVAPAWMNRPSGLLLAGYLVVGLGLAIYTGVPDAQRYIGFSGVGHGWLLIAFFLSPYLPSWLRLSVAVSITGKIVFEHSISFDIAQLHGYYTGARVLTEAHLYGGILAMPAILMHLVAEANPDRPRPSS